MCFTFRPALTRERGRASCKEKLQLARVTDRPDDSRAKGSVVWIVAVKEADYFHDRFAIVDSELWHFGSTVGGGYPGLTAVSRGWNAEDGEGGTGAVLFYERLWEKLKSRYL